MPSHFRSVFLRCAALLSLCLAGCAHQAPAPAATPGYTVINEMPRFWRFYDQAHDKDPDTQARLYLELVVAGAPELYSPYVLSLDKKGLSFEAALAERLVLVRERLVPHYDDVRKLSVQLERELPRYDARFRREFPDMAYTGKVYFMNALGTFDGAVRRINGQTALLFGVDMIVYIYGTGPEAEALFDHELFHLYHRQFFHPADEDGDAVWEQLWREGLATYVADRMNPNASRKTLFGLPEDTPDRALERLPKLAALLREKLDSKERADYEAFFSGAEEGREIPSRSGYFVGHRVAKKLANGRTLAQLAHLHGPSLREEIRNALVELEEGR
jgi:hypothetical protein